MNTRLQEINLTEFTGGFNAWRNQFNLADNESPDMLNMDIDPRGGFYTRKGWTRWNAADALGAHFDTTWDLTIESGDQTVAGKAVYDPPYLYLNDTDSAAVGRSSALAAVGVGDAIFVGDWQFTVSAMLDQTTHWRFTGTASGTTPAGGDDTAISCQIVGDWEPRHTFTHSLSTGAYVIYVTNDGQIENAGTNGVFSTLQRSGPTTVAVTADPHLADFAAWGDYLYIACGQASASHLRNGTGTPTSISDAATNYNDDYTTPDAIGAGAFPRCEFIETHAGYIFAAYIKDQPEPSSPTTPAAQPNRIRWSHPSQPENWAALDFIDIDAGGGRITGLRSFQDHLLIFKTDSVWALYGYDSDSWQLVRVSSSVGAPNTTAVTASESAVYFYSTTTSGGVYAYDGQGVTYISQSLRTITEEIFDTDYDDIWLGWVGKRLWCSLPWLADGARTGDEQTVFVFDPQVGNGAWVVYRPASGSLTSIVENSDIYTQHPLAVICGHAAAACLVQLDFSDEADDKLVEALTADPFEAYYTTGWQNAGWPERRKSWRRPRFILERVNETVEIDLETFFDYNESAAMRSHTITVLADGTAFWRVTGALEDGGFDWNDGTLWGASGAQGSVIERGVQNTATLSGLGVNRAIQLKFSTNTNYLGKAWGINAMTLKFILRRFTT